ncbi:lactococcin 972 family bacteriocin [Corynebacterium frankenforstense]
MIAGAGIAVAVPADGGDWDHGNSGERVWSNYWHPNVTHGSSVQGHEYVDSGCVAPNIWARAQAHSKYVPWGRDGAYYRFCS